MDEALELRPSWLAKSVWPFETYSVDTGRVAVAVTEVGSGPPLLFVHAGLWSFIWRDVMLRLAGEFRCICVDAPSNGLSQKLGHTRTTLEESARAIAAVIERLDLRDFTVVAHDLGGPVAMAGSIRRAQHVRGIVAINTFAWRPSSGPLRAMLSVMGNPVVRELSALTQFVPKLTATSFGAGRHYSGADVRAFLEGIGARGTHAFHDYMRSASHSDRIYECAQRALSVYLSHLPVLTIFGERNDPFGFQRHWKALFPNATQIVVPRGNHFPMCDEPDLVASSLRSWYRESVTTRNRMLSPAHDSML
ncbi:MAG: alpha/beta fold hydrolase [Candidatus Eremiobacteraeota bacterium]|nr:alpha/beta fold hydrolase [Candidatus Eremiobacteraeota bacterium]